MAVLTHLRFIPLLLAAAPLVSAGQENLCRCVPREVGASGSRKNWEGYSKGVRWHYEIDEALKMAQAEGKLVFWYHVVGDLDKEGC